MKKQIFFNIILLLGALLTAQNAVAQSNYKHKNTLYINEKGNVLDERGTRLGYISKEDFLFNSQGQKLGFVKGGIVYDVSGVPISKKKGGRFFNSDGSFVLEVKTTLDKCKALDPQGHNLGTTHKNYKVHACAAHCLFREKKLDQQKNK